MSDKAKLAIISEIISHYYEFFSTSDDARNVAALEAILDAIDTVIRYDEEDDANKYNGYRLNCAE